MQVWAAPALPGVLLTSWARPNVPFEIARDYRIPEYVGPGAIYFSSYSGNTEETLEALQAAEAAGAQIVAVAAGGKLAAHATEKATHL